MVMEDMQGEVKGAVFAQPSTETVKGSLVAVSLYSKEFIEKPEPDFSWKCTAKQ